MEGSGVDIELQAPPAVGAVQRVADHEVQKLRGGEAGVICADLRFGEAAVRRVNSTDSRRRACVVVARLVLRLWTCSLRTTPSTSGRRPARGHGPIASSGRLHAGLIALSAVN